MSTILEEGYIADDINRWVKENETKKGFILSIAYDLNRIGQKLFINSTPKGDNGLLMAALFARILEHFQAIILLEQRNISNSSAALVRVMLEAAFAIGACARQKDFHLKLADWDALAVKRLGERLQQIPDEISGLTESEKDAVNAQVANAKKEVNELISANKTKGITDDNNLQVHQIAKYAGFDDLYNSLYAYYGLAVHTAVRDLNNHVTQNEANSVRQINWGPDLPQREALASACAVLIVTIEAFCEHNPAPDLLNATHEIAKRLSIHENEILATIEN